MAKCYYNNLEKALSKNQVCYIYQLFLANCYHINTHIEHRKKALLFCYLIILQFNLSVPFTLTKSVKEQVILFNKVKVGRCKEALSWRTWLIFACQRILSPNINLSSPLQSLILRVFFFPSNSLEIPPKFNWIHHQSYLFVSNQILFFISNFHQLEILLHNVFFIFLFNVVSHPLPCSILVY